MRNNPMAFFSENVDSWGPLEWFDRLAKAVHARSQAVRDKDDIAFETYKNIASSSASRLVSDFEDKVRMALTTLSELEKANVAYVDTNTELLLRADAADAEVARLRKALEFYADPEIYKPHPHGPAFDRRDRSYHAQAALSSTGDTHGN